MLRAVGDSSRSSQEKVNEQVGKDFLLLAAALLDSLFEQSAGLAVDVHDFLLPYISSWPEWFFNTLLGLVGGLETRHFSREVDAERTSRA